MREGGNVKRRVEKGRQYRSNEIGWMIWKVEEEIKVKVIIKERQKEIEYRNKTSKDLWRNKKKGRETKYAHSEGNISILDKSVIFH